jgi:hypothetical protein
MRSPLRWLIAFLVAVLVVLLVIWLFPFSGAAR